MKHLAWPASFAAVGCWGVALSFAWDDIRPAVTLAILILLWSVVGVLLIALISLVAAWTVWRLQTTRADMQLNDMAVQHASEIAGDVRLSQPETNLWAKAYIDLGWLGWILGSLSLNKVRPYFHDNAERYWAHMTAAMKASGFARIETARTSGGRPYKTTVFVGSYRRYFRQLMHGLDTLPPHPTLPPPVISTNLRQNEMTDTTKTTKITETPGGVVFIGN